MATIHAFGPFRLDADTEILFRGSEPLPVGKRAVALLRVLVERAGVRAAMPQCPATLPRRRKHPRLLRFWP